MSPESIAVRQFLSKPQHGGHACCCMGPQRLDGKPDDFLPEHILKINEYPIHLKLQVMKTIREFFKVDFATCKEIVAGKEYKLEPYSIDSKMFARVLFDFQVNFEMKEANTGREPYCPCMMYYVELVDGNYYKISQTTLPDEGKIVFDAKLIGPIGGPYVMDLS